MTLDSLPDLEYKRVVSCKDSFHGTDVLAVSEHGAPGRRPNIHTHCRPAPPSRLARRRAPFGADAPCASHTHALRRRARTASHRGCSASFASSRQHLGKDWADPRWSRLGFLFPALVAPGVVLSLTRPVASLTCTNRGTADRANLVAARVEPLLAGRHDHVVRVRLNVGHCDFGSRVRDV